MHLLFLVLLSFPLTAQSDTLPPTGLADSMPVIAYWRVGDRYRFQVERLHEVLRDSVQLRADTTRLTALFEVTDSTADSYTVQWTVEEQTAQPNSPNNFIAEASRKLTSLASVSYVTDELGNFKSFVGLDELKKYISQYVDETFPLPPDGQPIDESDLLARNTLLRLNEPGVLEGRIFDYLQLLHYPFGTQFSAYDTLTYEEELPNLLGGDNVILYSSIQVDSFDLNDEYIHLKQFSITDSAQVSSVMQTALQTLAGASAEEVAGVSFEVYQDVDYHFYYFPGIPVFIDYYRETTIDIPGEGRQIDRRRIFIEWVE